MSSDGQAVEKNITLGSASLVMIHDQFYTILFFPRYAKSAADRIITDFADLAVEAVRRCTIFSAYSAIFSAINFSQFNPSPIFQRFSGHSG